MIQENSSNRQENIVAGDNSQLQFLSAVEEFKRAETDEEKAVAIEAMRIVANTGNKSAQYHMAAIYGNGDGVLMDLEEAVKCYEEGIACYEQCAQMLKDAEQKIEVVSRK